VQGFSTNFSEIFFLSLKEAEILILHKSHGAVNGKKKTPPHKARGVQGIKTLSI